MKIFAELFQLKESHNIVDVGGAPTTWSYVKVTPKVTITNIDDNYFDGAVDTRFKFVTLDGTRMPFDDNSFDIAFSNSVIEHVGDWDKQVQFAEEVRRVAPYYYVQTPNKWFFIEPHFVSPFIHMLPKGLFRRLMPFMSVWYWKNKPSPQKVSDRIDSIKLLDAEQMRQLFPDAQILREKFLFMTKSIIAVRAPSPEVSGSAESVHHYVPKAQLG